MSPVLNSFQQPIGACASEWIARARPERITLHGSYCRLEPLDADRHAAELYAAHAQAADQRGWTYMLMGPFDDLDSYRAYVRQATQGTDPLHYAVIDLFSGKAVGTLALMRIDTANGAIEVGTVMFSPALQRTPASTEAQYLLMRYAFDTLGYRRYEWKCDSLNAPSRQAAQRLGFQFEGIFRQSGFYKGRSRDTAWFAIIRSDWPALRQALEQWLAPDNLQADGKQRQSLAALRAITTT